MTLEIAPEVISTVCPYCGANRAGTAGSAHGCSTVATMPSKSGKGIVFAPMAVEDRCEECGQKQHRNLPRHERLLLCAWQQFSADNYPGIGVSDRWGVHTDFAGMTPDTLREMAAWMESGKMRVKARKPRGRKPTVVVAETASPMARSIAEDVNENPPKKMTKAERIAAELKRQQEEEKH